MILKCAEGYCFRVVADFFEIEPTIHGAMEGSSNLLLEEHGGTLVRVHSVPPKYTKK